MKEQLIYEKIFWKMKEINPNKENFGLVISQENYDNDKEKIDLLCKEYNTIIYIKEYMDNKLAYLIREPSKPVNSEMERLDFEEESNTSLFYRIRENV